LQRRKEATREQSEANPIGRKGKKEKKEREKSRSERDNSILQDPRERLAVSKILSATSSQTLPLHKPKSNLPYPIMSGLISDEIAEDYKSSLEDLVTNDASQIRNLTVIAKENTEYAQAISRVLENHIRSVGAPLARSLR
jgi:hypothetical protein